MLRSDPQQIAREVLVPLPNGGAVPLGQVAKVELTQGPRLASAPRTRCSAAYIYVDIRDRDIGGYVADAKQGGGGAGEVPARVLRHLERPVRIHGARHRAGSKVVVPLTLLIIFLLLYLNFRRLTETLIVMLSVPFALVGGVWLMWWLGYNLSVAVAVGFIALAGVAAETGVIMLIYLDHAWQRRCSERARPKDAAVTPADLYAAVMEGAVERVRPEDDDRRRDHGRPAADHVEHAAPARK